MENNNLNQKAKKSKFLTILAIIIGIVYAFALFWAVYLATCYIIAPEGETLGPALGAVLGWIIYVLIVSVAGFVLTIPGLITAIRKMTTENAKKSELILYIIYAIFPVVLNAVYIIVIQNAK